jgi:plastocyanin
MRNFNSRINPLRGLSRILVIVILVIVIAIAAVSVLYISSLGSTASNCDTTSTANTNSAIQISIISGAYNQANAPGYNPDKVTLVLGVNSTVVWKNNDSVHHTVTTSSAPSGASFSSGDIPPGTCFAHIFITVGTYKYYCTYHAWMIGEIVVLNSTAS